MIDRPMVSAAAYPKIFSAPLFQLVMIPCKFLLMMASSDDATIAARRALASSARLRSVMSWKSVETPPSAVG